MKTIMLLCTIFFSHQLLANNCIEKAHSDLISKWQSILDASSGMEKDFLRQTTFSISSDGSISRTAFRESAKIESFVSTQGPITKLFLKNCLLSSQTIASANCNQFAGSDLSKLSEQNSAFFKVDITSYYDKTTSPLETEFTLKATVSAPTLGVGVSTADESQIKWTYIKDGQRLPGITNQGEIGVIKSGQGIITVEAEYRGVKSPPVALIVDPKKMELRASTNADFMKKGAWNNEEWTSSLKLAIESSGLLDLAPADMYSTCPMASTKELKTDCYMLLFQALAKKESSFNPKEEYPEDMGVISAGLFQISIASAKAYKCEVEKHEDLLDANKNIACAVKIATRLIKKHKNIGGREGMGAYWSAMRPTYTYTTTSGKILTLGKLEEVKLQISAWL